MVTMYNEGDMKSFGEFIADWQKKGMLKMDKNGNPIFTKGHVRNWKLGTLKYSICPKAINYAQMLTYQKVCLDRCNYGLMNSDGYNGVGRLVELAISEGVVIAFPWVNKKGMPVANAHQNPTIKAEGLNNNFHPALSVREVGADFPFVHVSAPFASFPIYEGDKVIAFGACFHISDIESKS